MTLEEKIAEWKRFPNALGSEAQAAVIVGEISNALEKDIPVDVSASLKKLALRGTMRDIAKAIQSDGEENPDVPSFHDVVNVGAAASGLSWTEAISIITRHFDGFVARLD